MNGNNNTLMYQVVRRWLITIYSEATEITPDELVKGLHIFPLTDGYKIRITLNS